MRSVAAVNPGTIEIIEIPEPIPGPYEVVVKSEISLFCNATDKKLIHGKFPGLDTADCFPMLLGHETVGKVVKKGEKAANFSLGDRVIGGLLLNTTKEAVTSGWGGMSDYVVAVDAISMIADGKTSEADGYNELWQIMQKVPKTIPVEAAGMLCTWREVYAGFSDFQLTNNEEILIFGAGPVGLSFVRMAHLFGFPYIGCVDPVPEKLELAKALGASEIFHPEDQKLEDLINTRGKGMDSVIDAVGSEAVINQGLKLLNMTGKMCVYGVIDNSDIQLDKSQAPMNFNLFIHQWPTRQYEAEATGPLCRWIEEGEIGFQDFITQEYPVDKVNEAFEALGNSRAIKTLLRWDSSKK